MLSLVKQRVLALERSYQRSDESIARQMQASAALIKQMRTFCDSHPTTQGLICLEADMFSIQPSNISASFDALIDKYPSGSFERTLLVYVAGEQAYSIGDRVLASDIWCQYLPPNALIIRAYAVAQSKDYGKAETLLNCFNQDFIPGTTALKSSYASAIYPVAWYAYENERFPDAELLWRRAIGLFPDRAPYYHGLSAALRRQKRWNEAAAASNKAIQLDPVQAHYYVGLADALINLGDMGGARDALVSALAIDPGHEPAERLLDQINQSK